MLRRALIQFLSAAVLIEKPTNEVAGTLSETSFAALAASRAQVEMSANDPIPLHYTRGRNIENNHKSVNFNEKLPAFIDSTTDNV